jgi:enamidase
VLGDFTPRQKTVDFLDSYVHGGITSVVSAGEIHAPGRPQDAVGVVALAIAAKACFEGFRPNGMTVHAGSVVLEPTLERSHFAQLQAAGVRFAKFGFGAYRTPTEGIPQIRMAQEHGITVMSHSGGASIPGSSPITPDHLMALLPDVCGHLNGGTTSLDDFGVRRIVEETEMALQIVQAGNLRAAIQIMSYAQAAGALHRVVIGSDTPTGTGVMPLGVLKTIAELTSFTDLDPATVWALATGNNARTFGIRGGKVAPGEPADLVFIDAPLGSLGPSAGEGLTRGDIPGVAAVLTDGEVRCLTSRNTPRASRSVDVTS